MLDRYLQEHDMFSSLKLPWCCPFPKAEDREKWEGIPEEDRNALLQAADEAMKEPYPLLKATAFMAFSRDGNRQVFEQPYFFRRRKLILSALAYCIRQEAGDLDEVLNGIWCICEESSWVISAHNNDAHEGSPSSVQKPLPDTRSPVVDLFAAQTGMILSLVLHMTEDQLDRVTPMVRMRAEREMEERLLKPFETRDDFWWMGFLRRDLCNWTPWIVSNILMTSALQVKDRYRLSLLVERGLRMTDRWLQVLPEDGGCDEGAAYWNMAGGAFLDILELTASLTGSEFTPEGFSPLREEKIRNILKFPMRVCLGNGWFANFADCDARPYVCGERLYAAGRALGDEELKNFGLNLVRSIGQDVSDTPQLWRLLNRLFMPKACAGQTEHAGDVLLPDLQVRGVRRGSTAVYIKGGHNGESHNHNDVGSFILFRDGEPVFIDIGNVVYTAKTFSGRRYELFNTRSRNHSVPMFGQVEQAAGSMYAGSMQSTENGCRVEMQGAYPQEAGLLRLTREMDVKENGDVTIQDTFSLREPGQVTEVYMLRQHPEKIRDGLYAVGQGLVLEVTGGEICGEDTEEIPVEDPRLSKSYPGSLFRLAITFKTEGNLEITCRICREA